MKAYIVTPGNAPFWLAGNPSVNLRQLSEALNHSLVISRDQQSISGADWDTKQHEDRGNQEVTYSFEVNRQFEHAFDVMDFIARCAPIDPANALHDWQGDVWLRIDRGGEFKAWNMPRAVLSLTGVRMDGEVGVYLTYRVKSGGFSDTASGGINVQSLWCWTSIDAATIGITGDQLDAFIAAAGVGYGYGYFEIIRTDAAGNVQTMAWDLAGYGSTGFGFPIGSHFAEMVADWTAEYGAEGVETTSGPWRLDVTAGSVGEESYVAMLIYVDGGIAWSSERTGGLGGRLDLTDDDGDLLEADLG